MRCLSLLLYTLLLIQLPHLQAEANEQIHSLPPESVTFLNGIARDTLKSCVVESGAASNSKTNTLGFRAITPGGYPAIWVQDFTISFSSGLIPREDGVRHLQLILSKQNGAVPLDLGKGVIVPAYAIADHINVDGSPVYFPGTYNPIANQNGDWGFRPPSNNQYDVTWLAHLLARTVDAETFLTRNIEGITIFERLKLAFDVPEINPATQLVRTNSAQRAVGFIFYDSVYMTGDLLMASLIRYRTALQLAWLATSINKVEEARHYTNIAEQIKANIIPTFANHPASESGWLKASTGISSQADVWGSIYSIYVGAVDGVNRTRLLNSIAKALKNAGEIEFEGALRHVPLSGDATPVSAWERAKPKKNHYMNGAYWHTPVGWLLAVLQPEFPELAHSVQTNWLNHLRAQDGKVWECIGWDGSADKNPLFSASITLPLGVLKHSEGSANQLLKPEDYFFQLP